MNNLAAPAGENNLKTIRENLMQRISRAIETPLIPDTNNKEVLSLQSYINRLEPQLSQFGSFPEIVRPKLLSPKPHNIELQALNVPAIPSLDFFPIQRRDSLDDIREQLEIAGPRDMQRPVSDHQQQHS